MYDGLFDGQQDEEEEGSPDGIENVDISDIQKMINKSSESPGILEQVDHEMLNDFMNQGEMQNMGIGLESNSQSPNGNFNS